MAPPSERGVPFVSVPQAAGIFLIGGMLITVIAAWFGWSIAVGLFLDAVLAGPLVLVAIYCKRTQNSQRQSRTVSLREGIVAVHTAEGRESSPIEKCCWFTGRITDDGDLNFQNVLTERRIIILVLATGRRVACGLTEEMHQLWMAALREHDVRAVFPRSGLMGEMIVLLVAVLRLCGMAAGGAAGWYAATALIGLFPAELGVLFVDVVPTCAAIFCGWIAGCVLIPLHMPGLRISRAWLIANGGWAIMKPLKLGVPSSVLAENWPARLLALAFTCGLLCIAGLLLHLLEKQTRSGNNTQGDSRTRDQVAGAAQPAMRQVKGV